MAAGVERTVVQTAPQEEKAIAAKAKKLGLPISERMRRGTVAYPSSDSDEELQVLAEAARGAAERSAAAIDDALDFIAASNARIAAMEAQARRASTR